jgi:alpha-tubulin suppressor-like RCC1 family protein
MVARARGKLAHYVLPGVLLLLVILVAIRLHGRKATEDRPVESPASSIDGGDVPSRVEPSASRPALRVDAGIAAPARVIQVVAGDEHTCAVFESGVVRCWGLGAHGRLGTGSTANIGDDELPRSVPPVELGGRAVQLAAGGEHTCALLDTGAVRCWGLGENGRLGYGTRDDIGDDETPAAAGDVSLGERATQITASGRHTCALLASGAVRCWGKGAEGKLGLGDVGWSDIGDDELPSSVPVVDVGGRVLSLHSTGGFTCALLDSGTVRCWGPVVGASAGVDEPPALCEDVALGVKAVALGAGSGSGTACAITAEGRARCWGIGQFSIPGYESSIIGINPGDLPTPAELGDLPLTILVRQIGMGSSHACALDVDGGVVCWGDNRWGLLGSKVESWLLARDAVRVELGDKAIQLAVGGFHACALLERGSVQCWGLGESGQLGHGSTENIGETRSPRAAGDVPL